MQARDASLEERLSEELENTTLGCLESQTRTGHRHIELAGQQPRGELKRELVPRLPANGRFALQL